MLLNKTNNRANHSILNVFAHFRTVIPCLVCAAVPSWTGQARDAFSVALDRFVQMDPAQFMAQLDRERPPILSPESRAKVIAALPTQGEHKNLTAANRSKLQSLMPILGAHGREKEYVLKVIEARQAQTGLHARFVLLITEPALSALSAIELQALVAHEIGHEYVWEQYETARKQTDWRRLRELELYCDGLAMVTLVKIGADPLSLTAALQVLRATDRARGITDDEQINAGVSLLGKAAYYPTFVERAQFARELHKWLSTPPDFVASRAVSSPLGGFSK